MKIKYQDIIKLDNLREGLIKIKSNLFSDLNEDVKINFNDKKLIFLNKELKSQKFKPSPVRQINITNPEGGIRPLRLASQKDNIVQAAILNQLDPLLENIFLNYSYGGRLNKNCHHVLKTIKTKWKNVNWIINIDIQEFFDTANYDILLKMLDNYCDQATLELIQKFLKSGYINFYSHTNKLEKSKISVFKSSLMSSTLSNFYLHQFDCFMENEILTKFQNNQSESVIENGNIYYIRYFDDFLIGLNGTKIEAEYIKNSIETFLVSHLKLKLKETTNCIFHSSDKNIIYLGFFIRYITVHNNFKYAKNIINKNKSSLLKQVQLRIPIEKLLKFAVELGYGKIRKNGTIRPSSYRKLSSSEDKLIVQKFSSIIYELVEFYSPANQRSDLWQVVSFYKKACALTLADKHNLKTAAAVYKKYGLNLKISNSIQKKEIVLFYPTTLKSTGNFKLTKSRITLSQLI